MHNATFPKWIVIAAGGVLGLAAFAVVMIRHEQELRDKLMMTRLEVGWVSAACTNFFAEHRRWPASLQECATNYWVTTNDAWGRPMVFVPFALDRGFGSVMSFGRDGRPGGTGADADVESRFGK